MASYYHNPLIFCFLAAYKRHHVPDTVNNRSITPFFAISEEQQAQVEMMVSLLEKFEI
jgi:hypothetical protein